MTEVRSEWVDKADAHLEAARTLMRQRKMLFLNQVCFLCQQAVEKYYKAFLTANQATFAGVHNLLQLSDLCIEIDRSFEPLAADVAKLDLYAVETRYPGHEATGEEARFALAVAQRVARQVSHRLEDQAKPRLF